MQEEEIECRTWHGVYQGDGTLCAETGCGCTAELTGDGMVNVSDLLELIVQWGPCSGACPADLDGDGQVAFPDLVNLLTVWNTSC
ncbi:MAG: hypothetical protein ACYTGP_09240 [Planctomycetota bacterium]|jgi:hypothetical protein